MALTGEDPLQGNWSAIAPPPPAAQILTPDEAHAAMNKLESRLARLEKLVGPASPLQSVSTILSREVKIQESLSLSTVLYHLTQRANSITAVPLISFGEKCHQLRQIVQNDETILSTQAKRLYIIENEKYLKDVAEQLKALEELKPYVNSPSLANFDNYHERYTKLEDNGFLLSQKAEKLDNDLQALVTASTTAMQTVFRSLQEASDYLSKIKSNQRVRRKDSEEMQLADPMQEGRSH